MAIPDNYIDKIKNKDSGESRIISPAADKVRVDNENFDGTDLDEVLDEVAQAIEEAGSGDGTVTGVKMNNGQPIPPDENGVVDLGTVITDVSNKVDKVTGYGLSKNDYTDADKTAVATIPSKANDADVVKSISVNGTAQPKDGNGNVNIQVQGGNGNVSVIQPDPADGTFIIRVGENDYTININHEHPEYAPLVHTHSQYAQVQVVNGESNLPATLDPKTIYGVKADGVDELEMVVIGGYKFYGGGGGAPGQPVLQYPTQNTPINMGKVDNGYDGNLQQSITKQVYIKARNITQPINVSVGANAGFSIENSVSQISVADARSGVNINVVFDGRANSQGGTLVLQSTELGTIYYDLDVEYVTYELLDSVGLTGSQWTKSTYKINSATKVEMTVKFTENSNTRVYRSKTGSALIRSYAAADYQSSHFGLYVGGAATNDAVGAFMINCMTNGHVVVGSNYQQLSFKTNTTAFLNKGTIVYAPGSSNADCSFNNVNKTVEKMGSTAATDTFIGLNPKDSNPLPFDNFDLKIYGLVFSEGGTNQRNFVPVLRDDVACLYDTVTGETLFSLGSEDFVANQLSNS